MAAKVKCYDKYTGRLVRPLALGKVTAVDESMAQASEEGTADGLVREAPERAVPLLVGSLRDQSNRIVRNWALRVATLPAFRAMPNLALEDVQRRIPQILNGALVAIGTSDPTMDPEPLERAAELAAAHGRARLAEDFAIGDVLAEFHALRHETWSALWRAVETDSEALELVRDLEARFNETFDALIVAAAEAWVDGKVEGMTGR